MKIKVQCPCGSRFEFEAEPVDGHMPVSIQCPTCGADATALANEVIQLQSAAAPVARLRVSGTAHAAPAPVAPAVAEEESTGAMCARHQSIPAVETCHVCGKPICEKCMEQFGFVCSAYCRQQANQKSLNIPVYGRQKSVVAERAYRIAKRLTYAALTLAALAVGLWIWYAWFAREPKMVYSLPIPKRDTLSNLPAYPREYYKLIAPGQLLSVKNKNVSLFDIAQQHQLWSTPLPFEAEPTSSDFTLVTSNEVWLSFHAGLVRLDRHTGQVKESPVRGRVLVAQHNDEALIVESLNPKPTLTRFLLADGSSQSVDLTTPVTNISAQVKPSAKSLTQRASMAGDGSDRFSSALSAVRQAVKPNESAATDDEFPMEELPSLALAGQSAVQLKTRLLEKLTITHEAMKPKGKSVLDDSNVTASQGMDLAQEMMNDSARAATGGVEIEDVSRYAVTLHQWFASDAPDWTGEVVGPPRIYSLKTVILLVAGQGLTAFDQHNKKLWDAKLTFAAHLDGHQPWLETKDSLYFADAGMLTRFDLATGNVRWRLESAGISSIHTDAHGDLYIASTTASPEQVLHPLQVNLHDKIHPLILKVSPDTGKILWRLESIGDDCAISGKFLYATRISKVTVALRLEDGPDTHYDLKLLEPSNGDAIWEYHKVNHVPFKTDVEQNWIMLQFDDEVRVLKFFSL